MNSFKQKISAGIILYAIVFSLIVPFNLKAQKRELTQDTPKKDPEKRIALVIGNGAYQKAKPLNNPANDATDMSKTLKELGFEVLSGINQTRRQTEILIRDFGKKLADSGGIGLFYYAGHGIQVKGENYLVPIDADIPEEDEVSYSAIPINLVLSKMTAADNALNIIILDACRNNPFARSWRGYRDNATADGLAKISPPRGTLILYASEPGKVASDGQGRNGLFTEALLKEIKKPNVEYDQMVRSVTSNVWQRSNKQQLPWKEGNTLAEFYFIKEKPTVKAIISEPTFAEKPAIEREREAWDLVKNSTDAEDFRLFLNEFPNGVNAAKAKIGLEELVWFSVKDSKDKEKLEAYLKEFPNGANASSARILLRRLEARNKPQNSSPNTIPKPTSSPNNSKIESSNITSKQETSDKLQKNTSEASVELPKNKSDVLTPVGGSVRKSSTGIELVYVPAGEFMMGSSEVEIDGFLGQCNLYSNCKREDFKFEMPKIKTPVKEGFWMGKFEITQSQWVAIMGENPSSFKECGGNCPVESISWNDVRMFIKRLNSGDTEFKFDLPSDVQWEYAARAKTTTAFSFGNSINSSQANFDGNFPYNSNKGIYKAETMPVGSYSPNNFGLFDMHGNVWELTQGSYVGSDNKPFNFARGGSWSNFGINCRSANKDKINSNERSDTRGFRVVAYPRNNSDKSSKDLEQSVPASAISTANNLKNTERWQKMLERGESKLLTEETTEEIKKNPSNILAYRMRVEALRSESHIWMKWDFDKDTSNKIIQLVNTPQSPEDFEALCFAYYKTFYIPGDDSLKNSLRNCDRVIELSPQSFWAYHYRGYTNLNLRKIGNAIKDFLKAIENYPNYKETYMGLAMAYSLNKENDKAMKILYKAVELFPTQASVYSGRAMFFHRQGQLNKALEDLNKAVELNPEYVADRALYYLLYTPQLKNSVNPLRNYEMAIEDFTKAIELNPNSDFLYAFRAKAYEKVKDKEKAKADKLKADELRGVKK